MPTRSDSGPVGAQFRDALGLGSSDSTEELSPPTEAALASRGLEIRQRIGKGGYANEWTFGPKQCRHLAPSR